jgi:site-specific DNA-methyltransferase (adenine-specific)/modification methylase
MFTAQLMTSNPKLWRYNLIWDKINRPTGFLNANRCQLRIHEDIAVFYQSQPTYNPQMTKGVAAHRRGAAGNAELAGGKNRCYGGFKMTNPEYSNEKFPTSIIAFEKEHDGNQWHPTQKPVELIRYLIRTYTNEGETVLDNCCGSGTTAIAAIREKRNYICIEKDPHFYEVARKRIDNELRQPTLF